MSYPARAERLVNMDNSAIYTVKLTSKWLQDHNIAALSWPAKFPDVTPFQNLWAISGRQVYADGRRFKDKEMLWYAVKECWEAISNDMLLNLINLTNKQ